MNLYPSKPVFETPEVLYENALLEMHGISAKNTFPIDYPEQVEGIPEQDDITRAAVVRGTSITYIPREHATDLLQPYSDLIKERNDEAKKAAQTKYLPTTTTYHKIETPTYYSHRQAETPTAKSAPAPKQNPSQPTTHESVFAKKASQVAIYAGLGLTLLTATVTGAVTATAYIDEHKYNTAINDTVNTDFTDLETYADRVDYDREALKYSLIAVLGSIAIASLGKGLDFYDKRLRS